MTDNSDAVDVWVKNNHIGFEVLYVYRGVVRKDPPDFLVRLRWPRPQAKFGTS